MTEDNFKRSTSNTAIYKKINGIQRLVAECNITTYEGYMNDILYSESFAFSDIVSILLNMKSNNLISGEIPIHCINDVYVDKNYRKCGHGTSVIKAGIASNKDDVIFVISGISGREYEEEPTTEEIQEILIELDKFYTKDNLFIDVNKYIGCYENRHTYLYNNEIGNKIIQYIKKCY